MTGLTRTLVCILAAGALTGCRYFLAPMVDEDAARAAWAWTRDVDGGQRTVDPADAGWSANGTSTENL